MENFLFFLSWAIQAIFIIAKVALTKGKKIGWFLQIFGTFGAIIIAFSSEMYVWFTLEMWAICLYLYSIKEWGKEMQSGFDQTKKILTTLSGLLMLGALLSNITTVAILETLAAGVFMFGTILLSNKHESYQTKGWLFYALGHIALSGALYLKGLNIFVIQQFISVVIAIWRIKKPEV